MSIDAGGTNTRVEFDGGGDKQCKVVSTDPTNYGLSMKTIITTVKDLAQGRAIDALGLSVAGVVKEGKICGSGNLRDWVGKKPAMTLGPALRTSVNVINDTQAAALSEYSQCFTSLLYVIWGTGVGMAAMLAPESDKVPICLSTEGGHITIDCNSLLRCGCGGYGHLEALVGGGNLQRRFGVSASELTNDQWAIVFDDMAVGLRAASSVFMNMPIVLGGGVTFKQASRLGMLQGALQKLNSPAAVPSLSLSYWGEDAGLVGAAYAAKQLLR